MTDASSMAGHASSCSMDPSQLPQYDDGLPHGKQDIAKDVSKSKHYRPWPEYHTYPNQSSLTAMSYSNIVTSAAYVPSHYGQTPPSSSWSIPNCFRPHEVVSSECGSSPTNKSSSYYGSPVSMFGLRALQATDLEQEDDRSIHPKAPPGGAQPAPAHGNDIANVGTDSNLV